MELCKGSTQTQKQLSNYPAAFERAVSRHARREGGYVDNRSDPGGETKFGISKREYPQAPSRRSPAGEAIAIYSATGGSAPATASCRADRGEDFDLAVNIGPEHAVRCLQRALRACVGGSRKTERSAPRDSRRRRAANQLALSRRCAPRRPAITARWRRSSAGDAQRRLEFLTGWLQPGVRVTRAAI